MKVSVIVPVYKVEALLPRCLDSLMAQTLDEVEFLLVDDGSPDNCGKMCDEYAAKDPRFVVFHKKNGGLASARNYGIRRAKGDYLMFLDSDDFVHPDFCKIPYELTQKYGVDMVMFMFRRYADPSELTPTFLLSEDIDQSSEGFATWQEGIDLLHREFRRLAWNKIYKRELFDDVCYPEGRYYEDQDTTWRLIHKAGKIYYTHRILYYYYRRADSITHTKSKKVAVDRFETKMSMYEGFKSVGYTAYGLDDMPASFALVYAMNVKYDPSDEAGVRARGILKNVKKVPKSFSRNQKLMMFLYLYMRPLFHLVSRIKGKRVKNA